MALNFNNTHALAGNVMAIIGVDGGVLKELKSNSLTITPAGGASFGTGTYGEHLRTGGSGFSVQGANWTPAIPQNTTTTGYTVFMVVNAVTTVAAGTGAIFKTDGNFGLNIQFASGKVVPAQGDNIGFGTGTITAVGNGAHSLAVVRPSGTSPTTTAYVDGSVSASAAGGNSGGSATIIGVGGNSSAAVVDANIVYMVFFDKVLSQSEIQDLHSSLGANNQFGLVTVVSGPPPTVNTHPSDATVTAPATANFSISATGASSYQWQRSTNGGGSWTDVTTGTGATTTTYTTAATSVSGGNANNGDRYRCACTNVTGTTYSNGAILTVNAPGDTNPPTLSVPVGTKTGQTTATVGATTNEGNGTFYSVVTTSSTPPTATQVMTGQNAGGTAAAWSGNLAISSTGAKTIGATGLTAATTYYSHSMHRDAAGNNSNVVTSSSFTTDAATVYSLVSPFPLKNLTTSVLATTTIPKVAVLRLSDMAFTLALSNQVTNASGYLTISHASLASGVDYLVLMSSANGAALGAWKATAS